MSDDDTEFTISLGVERGTRNLTGRVSDKPRWSPSFGINYQSGRFFASTELGLGYNLVQHGDVSGFVAIGADPGRKAGDSQHSPRLVGMGKVASAGLGMVGVRYQLLEGRVSISAVQVASSKRSQGSQTLIHAVLNFPIWEDRLSGSLSLGAAHADRSHAQTYYGVSPAQSTRSGNPVYSPRGGWITCDTSVGLNYVLDSNWTASASVGRQERIGVASRSPLFDTKKSTVGSASVGYRF